jgi:hypothetical protein
MPIQEFTNMQKFRYVADTKDGRRLIIYACNRLQAHRTLRAAGLPHEGLVWHEQPFEEFAKAAVCIENWTAARPG